MRKKHVSIKVPCLADARDAGQYRILCMNRIARYRLQHRGAGYSITLPPKWVRALDLKPGAPIHVYDAIDALVIKPERNGE